MPIIGTFILLYPVLPIFNPFPIALLLAYTFPPSAPIGHLLSLQSAYMQTSPHILNLNHVLSLSQYVGYPTKFVSKNLLKFSINIVRQQKANLAIKASLTLVKYTLYKHTSLLCRLRADPFQCYATNRQNPAIQQNRHNF